MVSDDGPPNLAADPDGLIQYGSLRRNEIAHGADAAVPAAQLAQMREMVEAIRRYGRRIHHFATCELARISIAGQPAVAQILRVFRRPTCGDGVVAGLQRIAGRDAGSISELVILWPWALWAMDSQFILILSVECEALRSDEWRSTAGETATPQAGVWIEHAAERRLVAKIRPEASPLIA